jgi:hypothetical protein
VISNKIKKVYIKNGLQIPKVSAAKLKIFFFVFSKIKNNSKEIQFSLDEIENTLERKILNSNFQNEENKIINIILSFSNLSYKSENDKKILTYNIFSSVEFLKKEKIFFIKLNKENIEIIENMEKYFYNFELWNVLKLTKKYSINLYCFLKKNQYLEELEITPENLCAILDCTKTNLKRSLDQALFEIKFSTDLEISVEKIAKNYKFNIDKKDANILRITRDRCICGW